MGKRGPKGKYEGGSLTHKGYIRGYDSASGRYRMYHDVVWERYNGPIPEGFDIHHLNGNKTDNRIENLELISKLEHKRIHSGCYKNDKGEWIKPCRKCEEYKYITEFYERKDSISPWCRKCCIENATKNKKKRKKKQSQENESGQEQEDKESLIDTIFK